MQFPGLYWGEFPFVKGDEYPFLLELSIYRPRKNGDTQCFLRSFRGPAVERLIEKMSEKQSDVAPESKMEELPFTIREREPGRRSAYDTNLAGLEDMSEMTFTTPLISGILDLSPFFDDDVPGKVFVGIGEEDNGPCVIFLAEDENAFFHAIVSDITSYGFGSDQSWHKDHFIHMIFLHLPTVITDRIGDTIAKDLSSFWEAERDKLTRP